jgi:hypothetical protein
MRRILVEHARRRNLKRGLGVRHVSFDEAFNDWSHQRGGIPLLNQSPFVTQAQVISAYDDRWKRLCEWVNTVDPNKRMVNPFFEDLMVVETGRACTAGRP